MLDEDQFGLYTDLRVIIAKKENGGYMLISTSLASPSNYIAGTITIFLEDGTMIKCYDKGDHDKLDGRSMALYSLTLKEIELLKKKNITMIRFTVKTTSIAESYSQTGDHTAKNYRRPSKLYGENSSGEIDYYETSKEVTKLFDFKSK